MNLNKNWFKKVEARYDDTAAAWTFDQRVGGMLDMLGEILDDRYTGKAAYRRPTVGLKYGSKFCKITLQDPPHSGTGNPGQCFVSGFFDLNGDIHMAAGWKKPCLNGSRGNFFEDDFGRRAFSTTGRVRYK